MWLLRAVPFLGLLASARVAGTIPELAVASGVSLGTWGPSSLLPQQCASWSCWLSVVLGIVTPKTP